LLDLARGYQREAFGTAIDESVFTEDVDDAGNSAGVSVNEGDGIGREDFLRSAGDAKTLADIALGLREGQRSGAGVNGDALAEVAQVRLLELVVEFGLAGEEDLKERVAEGLEIEKETELLERLCGEALRLVDDENGSKAGAIAFEKPIVEGEELLAFGGGVAGDGEIVEDEVEQIVGVQACVEDEGGGHFLCVQPVEEAAQDHGFAGAHFAGQQEEALAGLNAGRKFVEGRLGMLGDKQETRIGVDLERVFAKTKKTEDRRRHREEGRDVCDSRMD